MTHVEICSVINPDLNHFQHMVELSPGHIVLLSLSANATEQGAGTWCCTTE